MNLQEYYIIKEEAITSDKHSTLLEKEVVVLNPKGKEETIVLGAVASFIKKGYTMRDADF